MRAVHSLKVSLFVLLSVFFISEISFADVPEPQSGGVYFQGKGTKASEQYESTAGAPVYDYGKGLQWGPLHLKPSIAYRADWDSNVFYEPHDPKDDIIHNLITDTTLELPFGGGQHVLSGAYATDTQWFDRFSSQNHTDQTVRGDLKLNFVPFTLDVADSFQNTVDRAGTEFTGRVPRYDNTLNTLLEIPFSSFFLENEILDFNEDYRDALDNVFDHNELTIYQRVGYDWAPNTQILAEYGYIHIDYPNASDHSGDGNQASLGIRGSITERISYQVWAGGQWRSYKLSTSPDFNGIVFRSAVQYQASEFSTFTLKALRSPEESTFDNQDFYTRNRIQADWRRQIAERIFWNTHGILDYNEYSRITTLNGQDRTRRDYVWELGTGLEYKMPNDLVTLILEYRLASRDSTINDLNYDDHTVSLGAKASF